MTTKQGWISALIAVALLPGLLSASTMDYTDRTTWETAAGGAPTLTDNYNDVTVDEDLYYSPSRDGYSLDASVFGPSIDASPFESVNVNGTTDLYLICGPGTEVTFTFDNPTTTWGMDTRPAGGSYGFTVNYVTNGGDSGSFNVPSSDTVGFRGFIATNPFTAVTFTEGSGYGVIWAADNLASHPTPEPTTLGLLALGGLAVLRRRRRA